MSLSRLARTALLGAAVACACEQRRNEGLGVPSASEPSPNASVLPAPIEVGPKLGSRDAGHPSPDPSSDAAAPEPPRAIREDDVLLPEVELLRAAPGLALEAKWRWLEPPGPRSPEGNAEALARARDKTGFDMSLELSSLGRLRVIFRSRTFPFPPGTELRSRDDRYGHLLIWPGGAEYTPLPPGTLRATLADARVDAMTLSDASPAAGGSSALLGVLTQKLRFETSVGKLELEQAALPAAGDAGALLCRLLLELLAIAPESSACRPEWVPLRAGYSWASGARFELEVSRLAKRPELAVEGLATPPVGAAARRGELPGPPFVVLLEERELGELHSRALPPPAKLEPGSPKAGLVFQNRGDGPRYLLVDGVPVLWLRAEAEWLVSGLKPGRYTVQARDFFGAQTTPPRVLELPARFTVSDEPEKAAR
jgi:hypothetical protein